MPIFKLLNTVLNLLAILFIKIYKIIFYFMPKACRFYPTCSEYALQAFEKHNFFKACFLVSKRLLSCNIFNNKTGYDPVPD